MILMREDSTHWIAIFGEGLVGGSLRDLLLQRGVVLESRHEVNWGRDNFRGSLNQIQIFVSKRLQHKDHISFVWSAGRAGFAAGKEEVEQEFQFYQIFLEMISKLIEVHSDVHFSLHLVSSAGGLFEGQTGVNQFSVPGPRRPYGELKLRQEHALQRLSEKETHLKYSIYRLSTVYGAIHSSKRMGLISNLVHNGFLRLVTPISGDLTTLRDYVHSFDVAKIMVAGIQSHRLGLSMPIIFVLGGKPTSIYEIKSIIEFYLRHKVYINMSYTPQNSLNITFQSMPPPFGMHSMDIRCGIKDVLTQWHRRKLKVGI